MARFVSAILLIALAATPAPVSARSTPSRSLLFEGWNMTAICDFVDGLNISFLPNCTSLAPEVQLVTQVENAITNMPVDLEARVKADIGLVLGVISLLNEKNETLQLQAAQVAIQNAQATATSALHSAQVALAAASASGASAASALQVSAALGQEVASLVPTAKQHVGALAGAESSSESSNAAAPGAAPKPASKPSPPPPMMTAAQKQTSGARDAAMTAAAATLLALASGLIML